MTTRTKEPEEKQTERCTVNLAPSEAKVLDQLRGYQSRADFLRQLFLRVYGNEVRR